jgi:hypothetical protein
MRCALLAASVLGATSAQAATFIDEALFLDQIPSTYYQEDFNYTQLAQSPPSYQLAANFGPVDGYSFTASAPGPSNTNWLYSNIGALSIEDARDHLRITFTGAPVYWVGGLFYSSNDPGALAANADWTLTFSTGQSYTFTGRGFIGISSSTPIQWLTLDAIDVVPADPWDGDYYWPAVDRLYVGATTHIPEPTILGILPLFGLLLKRRS